MLVQWQTRDAGSPMVKYGTSPGMYTLTANGTNTTYTAADLCGAPANSTGFVNPGAINRVLLTGLAPSTRYYYIYGDAVSCYPGSQRPALLEGAFPIDCIMTCRCSQSAIVTRFCSWIWVTVCSIWLRTNSRSP